ncbi:MAG: formylglycine-generating enzyme family protein [Acidobacteriota bacterium]
MKEPKRSASERTGSSTTRSKRRLVYGIAGVLVLSAAVAILAGSGGWFSKPGADPHAAHRPGEPGSGGTKPDPATSALVGTNSTSPPGTAPDGMVWIPGGTFWMGCDDCDMPDTQPVHLVTVEGYWIDRTPVTNSQFAQFVKATGYVTIADRRPDPKDYPGADPESVVAGSAVFTAPSQDVPLDDYTRWWRYVPGASWKHPEGPGSTIEGREDHPVVQIAWEDAAAFAKWAGKRLPTEAEFEFAARAGMDRNQYAWGNELKPGGKWPANIWQGRFPSNNLAEDGYQRTSPVTAFPANGFGLYDVGGNVWQWCADWYRPDYFASLAASGVAHNPQGPLDSYDPQEPGIPKRVQKGGSFLCSDRYCSRYLVGSRGRGAADTGGSNTGFRCVKDGS